MSIVMEELTYYTFKDDYGGYGKSQKAHIEKISMLFCVPYCFSCRSDCLVEL